MRSRRLIDDACHGPPADPTHLARFDAMPPFSPRIPCQAGRDPALPLFTLRENGLCWRLPDLLSTGHDVDHDVSDFLVGMAHCSVLCCREYGPLSQFASSYHGGNERLTRATRPANSWKPETCLRKSASLADLQIQSIWHSPFAAARDQIHLKNPRRKAACLPPPTSVNWRFAHFLRRDG